MKSLKQKIAAATALLAAFVIAGGFVAQQAAFAATSKIYLSPSSKSVAKGQSFSVNVRVDPGGGKVDTPHVTASYDASKLQYISHSTSGSPFTTSVGYSAISGVVKFDSTYLGGYVTADSFVGSLTFKVIGGSGSTTSISLAGSDAAYAGDSLGSAVAGASVSIASPPPADGGGGGSTPPPSSGGGGSSTPPSDSTPPASGGSKTPSKTTTPTKKTTKPVQMLSAQLTVNVKDVQYTRATISVTSKEPAKAYIQFGLNGQLTSNTKVSGYATSHDIAIDPSMLVPGQTYTYIVVSTNKKGVTTKTAQQTFTTKGITVYVNVYDKNHKPLAGKTVTLHSVPQNATTNKDGQAEFTNVAPGTHHVLYMNGSKQYNQAVQVADNIKSVDGQQQAQPQHFSVVYGFTQASGWQKSLPWVIGVIVLLIVVVIGGWFVRRRMYFGGLGKMAATAEDQDVVVGGNNDKPETPVRNFAPAQSQGPIQPVETVTHPSNSGDTPPAESEHSASSDSAQSNIKPNTDNVITPTNNPVSPANPTNPTSPASGSDNEKET